MLGFKHFPHQHWKFAGKVGPLDEARQCFEDAIEFTLLAFNTMLA
jgi:hypothetical protein